MEIPYFYIHVESYVWQKDHYIHQFFARYSCTYCCTGRHDKSIFILPSFVRHPTKNSTFLRTHDSTGSEQNDVLFLENMWGQKVPLHIYRTYLSTLSHKRLCEKKKITMVKPFARSSGMDILNLAAPPGQSLRDGLAGDPYEGFYLIT